MIEDHLQAVTRYESRVHALVHWDESAAHKRARAAGDGPLAGWAIGVKDIIDTADMPTEMGSKIYRGHRPVADASCVAMLRAAGAVIMGKTVTCEFAGPVARETTNPHNPAHTPGGSSSGSAAAVADAMCAGGTGGHDAVIGPFDSETNGQVPRDHIDDVRGHEERRNFARTAVHIVLMPFFDPR